jgi:protein-disulfide isomerase
VGWKITGLIVVALVGVVGYQWVLIQTDRRTASNAAPATFEQVLTKFQNATEVEIPLSDNDPWLGDPKSKLRLVIFSDFQCPACQQFATIIADTKKEHPKLAVVFKHFPLGSDCNAEAPSNMHPLSCDVAYATEAAYRQGKFWPFHNAVFASHGELTNDALVEIARTVGLDLAQWNDDLVNPATRAKVEADVALGNRLKVAGTPTAWINGRAIPSGGLGFLNQLVDHVAKNNGTSTR